MLKVKGIRFQSPHKAAGPLRLRSPTTQEKPSATYCVGGFRWRSPGSALDSTLQLYWNSWTKCHHGNASPGVTRKELLSVCVNSLRGFNVTWSDLLALLKVIKFLFLEQIQKYTLQKHNSASKACASVQIIIKNTQIIWKPDNLTKKYITNNTKHNNNNNEKINKNINPNPLKRKKPRIQ